MSSTYYSEIMRLGPLGYWPLADAVGSATAKDVSGNGRDGTVHGTVTFGQAPLLKASTLPSALFDGSSGYISLPTAGLPTGAQPWSQLAWASLASIPANYPFVLYVGSNTVLKQAGMYFYQSTSKFGIGTGSVGSDIYSALSPTANHTYFFVATYDGTTAKFYCYDATANTNDVHSGARSFNLSYGIAQIGRNGTITYYWPGTIAHAALLNYALTPDQITRLYNIGQGAEGIVRGSHRSFGRVM